MAKANKGILDDTYGRILINDFSGGLVTNIGALSLALNQSPDMLNVVPFPGRLQYRGGWDEHAPIDEAADQCWGFYDQDGAKHQVIWRDGDVVDVVSGVEVVVESAVYTAGEVVACVDFNGILYWSTETVPLRYWDPAAPGSGAVAQTGVSAPPACSYLFVYNGSLVALNVKYGASPLQPTVFGWSAVNDPGSWDASDSQAVGALSQTARLQFGLNLGVAAEGVKPYSAFIIGRSDIGIYNYSGALGSLTEALVDCPVGCQDGASAQYMPSSDAFGVIVFMGTDAQFWETNGLKGKPISGNILPTLSSAVLSYLTEDNPRFWSGYNAKWQYYFCSVGGVHFGYKWETKAWMKFAGWPVGPTMSIPDSSGVPSLWIASADPTLLTFAQVALDQQLDGGMTAPSVYYKTPLLHSGDPEKTKEFHWAAPFFYNTGTEYILDAVSMPDRLNRVLTAQTLTFAPPPSTPTGTLFTLDSSLLDGSDVLAGSNVSTVGTGTPLVNHGRLACLVEGEGILKGLTMAETLKGTAAQFTIAYNSGTMDFELCGLEVRYIERGYMRYGGQLYNPEGGVDSSFNPYVPPMSGE